MNNIDNDFHTTVFCDESSIWTLRGPLYHHRKRGRHPRSNTIWGKNAEKVHIWSGITWMGAIPFVVSEFIQQKMIKNVIKPLLLTHPWRTLS
jgi:hypothetical protein